MKKLLVLVPLAFGCGTDSASGPEVLPNLTVPPVPENGIQVITPIIEDLQPSSDHEICTWTDAIVDESTDVRSTLSYQTEPPGHHVVLFYTLEHQPPGTSRECTDTDMATFRFLTGGSAGNGEANEAPGNLVYRLPKGAQLVVQHHYLNSSDQVLRGQAVINVNFANKGGSYVAAGNVAFVDSSLEVAEGETTQHIHCDLDRQLKMFLLLPHMHRWGKQITIDLTQAGTTNRLFDTVWDPSYTFHPPVTRFDPSTPMMLNQGDQIDISCTWNNDAGRTLPFGYEMCLMFGEFIDEQGMGGWACDKGNWVQF